MYPFITSSQAPPRIQGLEEHSLISVKEIKVKALELRDIGVRNKSKSVRYER